VNTFIAACLCGFFGLAYLAAKDLIREVRRAHELYAEIAAVVENHTGLINKHAGRLAQLEDSEKLCRSGLLFVAEKMDEAEHHRNLLDPERLAPSEN